MTSVPWTTTAPSISGGELVGQEPTDVQDLAEAQVRPTSPHWIGSTSAIASSPATEARRSSPVRTDLARGGGVVTHRDGSAGEDDRDARHLADASPQPLHDEGALDSICRSRDITCMATTFEALADPRRREILEALRGGERTGSASLCRSSCRLAAGHVEAPEGAARGRIRGGAAGGPAAEVSTPRGAAARDRRVDQPVSPDVGRTPGRARAASKILEQD